MNLLCFIFLLSLIFYSNGTISGLWCNCGGEKIPREELRATEFGQTINSIWDGTKVSLHAAKNEVVHFVLYLESAYDKTTNVHVSFDSLQSYSESITTRALLDQNDIFNYNGRNIELFYVRYLKIFGLSRSELDDNDERHVPINFRRPFISDTGEAIDGTGWLNRSHHDLSYPDILIPYELISTFNISSNTSQAIWFDITIPKTLNDTQYQGNILVLEGTQTTHSITVFLNIRPFELPDKPSKPLLIGLDYYYIFERHLGIDHPWEDQEAEDIYRRYIQMLWRHRIITPGHETDNMEDTYAERKPSLTFRLALNGTLFSSNYNYSGPGGNTGLPIYIIGYYGGYTDGWFQTTIDLEAESNAWENWFMNNSPDTLRFFFLYDSGTNYAEMEEYASRLKNVSGVGKNLLSMCGIELPIARIQTPTIDAPFSSEWIGILSDWNEAFNYFHNSTSKKMAGCFNGWRPNSGTIMTDDEGTATRSIPYLMFKKDIDFWLYETATYYRNNNYNDESVDLFNTSQTSGDHNNNSYIYGATGPGYSNGHGVLMYPGTDVLYPSSSYNVSGPFSSVRLKMLRRGMFDLEYLVLANAINNTRVMDIVDTVAWKVLWEWGCEEDIDPTWISISPEEVGWSNIDDDYQAALNSLAEIIEDDMQYCKLLPSLHTWPAMTPYDCFNYEIQKTSESYSSLNNDDIFLVSFNKFDPNLCVTNINMSASGFIGSSYEDTPLFVNFTMNCSELTYNGTHSTHASISWSHSCNTSTVSLSADIFCPSYRFVGEDSESTSFNISFQYNEYDLLSRSENIFLKKFSLMPFYLLPLSSSRSFSLSASVLTQDIIIQANVEKYTNYTEGIIDNTNIMLHLMTAVPGIYNTTIYIQCNDPCSKNLYCGRIDFSGEITGPLFSISSNNINFGDIPDSMIVSGDIFLPINVTFSTMNILPIPHSPTFDFNVDCWIEGLDSIFFNISKSRITHPSMINETFDISFLLPLFPRIYRANITCDTNEEYLTDKKSVRVPIEATILGSYPQISNSSITFPDRQVITLEQCQITLSNVGNEILIKTSSLIDNIDALQDSSFDISETCSSTVLYHGDYCVFTILFSPKRVGNFNATLRIQTNSFFVQVIDVSIYAYANETKPDDNIPFQDSDGLESQLISFIPYIVGVISFFIILLLLCTYIGRKKRIVRHQPVVIFIVFLTLYDFITDLFFSISLFSDKYIFYPAISSLILVFIFNSYVISTFLKGQLGSNAAFRKWFESNLAILTFIVVISTTNIQLMRLISSNLMGIPWFSAPLGTSDVYRLSSLGIFANIFEDIPQLCIQFYVAFSTDIDNWSIILVFSLAGTMLSLIYGIINRFLTMLYVRTDSDNTPKLPVLSKIATPSDTDISIIEHPLQPSTESVELRVMPIYIHKISSTPIQSDPIEVTLSKKIISTPTIRNSNESPRYRTSFPASPKNTSTRSRLISDPPSPRKYQPAPPSPRKHQPLPPSPRNKTVNRQS